MSEQPVKRAADIAAAWLASLGQRPVGIPIAPEDLRSRLDATLGDTGEDPGVMISELASALEPGLVRTPPCTSCHRLLRWSRKSPLNGFSTSSACRGNLGSASSREARWRTFPALPPRVIHCSQQRAGTRRRTDCAVPLT